MAWSGFKSWVSGIQGQLVLGLLGAVVLITLISTFVSSYLHGMFFAEWIDADARQRVIGLARTAAPLLRSSAEGTGADSGAAEATRARFQAQVDSPAVRAVALYDTAGRTRFRAPAGATPGRAPALAAVADGVTRRVQVGDDGEHVWRYLAPVPPDAGAAAQGVLLLDLSLAVLSDSQDRSLAVHLVLLVVLLAAGLAVSLLVARRIAAPIRQLARHAQAVSASIPSTPVPAVGAREVRSLARALNRMLRNLRNSMTRLRESEARYRGLFDRMPDVALELDRDGRVLAVNAAVEPLGWSRDEVLGEPVGTLVADADRQRVMLAVAHAVRTGALSTTAVHLRTTREEPRFGELCVALRDRGEAPDRGGEEGPRLVAILRDVTERKRADEDVAHAQRVLSINTLASGIAHEFNNVMATIIGTGSLLTTRPDLPDEVGHELNRMIEMARRGAALSAQVLAYTRRTDEPAAASDLDAVVRETMELLGRTLDKRVEILGHTASSLPRVKGDPTRLQQVLINLGINAGDAMPDGGTLTFEARPHTIGSRAEAERWAVEPGDYVEVAVRDDGVGMDRSVLARIFEPYYSTKRSDEGAGLGLSVVYGAIRGLGGGIDVESEPGGGTTFHLLLPVAGTADDTVAVQPAAAPDPAEPLSARAEARRPRPPRPTAEQIEAASGQTILVVEDEPDLRELSRRVLERRGYRIFAAADGFEAETILRERGADVDLVLLDINLPRRDGAATYDVLRELRPELPVVIVSAGGVTDHRIADLLHRGALTLLRKPYEFEDLEAVVVQALTTDEPTGAPRADG